MHEKSNYWQILLVNVDVVKIQVKQVEFRQGLIHSIHSLRDSKIIMKLFFEMRLNECV
jgi:hypothetical protein